MGGTAKIVGLSESACAGERTIGCVRAVLRGPGEAVFQQWGY